MAITIDLFHAVGKYPILRQPLIMRVRRSMAVFGRYLSAAFEIVSSPGAFRLGSLWVICCTVPGVVNEMFDIGVEFNLRTVSATSGRYVPGFGENCSSNVEANTSALSLAENAVPFGPFSGWVAGVLFNRLLLSLNRELS